MWLIVAIAPNLAGLPYKAVLLLPP